MPSTGDEPPANSDADGDDTDAAADAIAEVDIAAEARFEAARALLERRGPVDLDALLEAFVAAHAGVRQRGADWYRLMGTTVGGSELAAIMGRNPYSTFMEVVRGKVMILTGGNPWTGGGEACWWGTLFEDVLGAYVSADLGSPVRGDSICVQKFSGHRNSPDGYLVGRFYRGADGRRRLWSTDLAPEFVREKRILLLEFKCPLSRRPTGKVPAHYVPQVWSGLAVSAPAQLGLFVDAVFRKASVADLNEGPDYDLAYHREGPWEGAVAWGLILVYAPRLDAPRSVRLGWKGDVWESGDPCPEAPDADAAQAAWAISSTYFGVPPAGPGAPDVADLGDMEPRLFGRALGLIDRGRFPVVRLPPCFADGRGADLRGGAAVAAAVEQGQSSPPAGHWLFGVLPWKLLEVNYVPVERRPDFMAEVAPLIAAVHQHAAAAVASPDPAAYLARAARDLPGSHDEEPSQGGGLVVSEADLQSLFDNI